MASSNSRFFQLSILRNVFQQETLDEFSSEGLTAEDFSHRGWFETHTHKYEFSLLIKKMKYSIKEAFLILENLDRDQINGIFQGLSYEEAVGLTKYQIDIFLKYGLSKDELIGLGEFQIQALLALKKDGIKSSDLRSQNWINSYDHVVALLYLIRVKRKSFVEACD